MGGARINSRRVDLSRGAGMREPLRARVHYASRVSVCLFTSVNLQMDRRRQSQTWMRRSQIMGVSVNMSVNAMSYRSTAAAHTKTAQRPGQKHTE